jgi:hypothetical protein
VQVLHLLIGLNVLSFWNGYDYGIRNYGIEATFSGMTSLLNLIKIYQLVQKLVGGTDRKVISLTNFAPPPL